MVDMLGSGVFKWNKVQREIKRHQKWMKNVLLEEKSMMNQWKQQRGIGSNLIIWFKRTQKFPIKHIYQTEQKC